MGVWLSVYVCIFVDDNAAHLTVLMMNFTIDIKHQQQNELFFYYALSTLQLLYFVFMC